MYFKICKFTSIKIGVYQRIKEHYSYFELKLNKTYCYLSSNEMNKLIDFTLFCHFLVFWRNFQGGFLLDRGHLLEKGV